MDSQLNSFLATYNVSYIEHKHPAFFTVAEAAPYEKNFKFARTKNLFLTDGKGNFFMYCLPADVRADLKAIRKFLGVKDLTFGSEEELLEKLGLKPGHVTIFALIRNPSVRLLLDKRLWEADAIGFHPNVNTATLELTHKDFATFYEALPNKKEVVNLE